MTFPNPLVLCIWIYGNKNDDDDDIIPICGFISIARQ
jgi:hypothetical protein